MSEIDVSKCEFYYDNYCDCYRDSFGDWYHKCTDEELYNCYYKQRQQLKAENEQLKKCENFAIIDQSKRLYKLNKCLDEIEEIIKGFSCCEWFGNCECCELSDDKNPCLNKILQLIKQAKEGE